MIVTRALLVEKVANSVGDSDYRLQAVHQVVHCTTGVVEFYTTSFSGMCMYLVRVLPGTYPVFSHQYMKMNHNRHHHHDREMETRIEMRPCPCIWSIPWMLSAFSQSVTAVELGMCIHCYESDQHDPQYDIAGCTRQTSQSC